MKPRTNINVRLVTIDVELALKMGQQLDDIAILIAAANVTYQEAMVKFQRLAAVQMKNPKMLDQCLDALFPRNEAQKEKGIYSPKRDHIRELFESAPDLLLPGVKHTMWAAYNAVTRFEDYREVKTKNAGQRSNRVWFGAGADLKMKALEETVRIASSN